VEIPPTVNDRPIGKEQNGKPDREEAFFSPRSPFNQTTGPIMQAKRNAIPPLPYGLLDLDPAIQIDPGPPLRIHCYVQGCDQWLRPPARGYQGELCSTHKIRCHRSGTYSYRDPARNVIVARELFSQRIVGSPHKFESHRLGLEKSEDAATFNLYRSFQEAGQLNYIARLVTGLTVEEEPRIYLWGLDLTDDSCLPWDLLEAARNRFERKLPVKRPLTEPDAALYLPGHYLILNEVKLTSPNPVYRNGPRKDSQSLTKHELLDIYSDLFCPMLQIEKARETETIAYQLWRNVQFASWMAHHAPPGTQGYFTNLTRRGYEYQSFRDFTELVSPEFLGRVTQIYWEDMFVLAGLAGGKLLHLQEYLLTKTVNLQPAFDFRLW
jgi:hypothetical protein